MHAWEKLASEKGMHLKYLDLQGYGESVFEMARQKKIAIATSHIPTTDYEGIKFVKITDWTGGTNLYFLQSRANTSPALKQLDTCVEDYTKSL